MSKREGICKNKREIILSSEDAALLAFFNETPRLKKAIIDLSKGKKIDWKNLSFFEKIVMKMTVWTIGDKKDSW